jgi:hypothetical protein
MDVKQVGSGLFLNKRDQGNVHVPEKQNRRTTKFLISIFGNAEVM